MDIKVRVWRQTDASSAGKMVTYGVKDISPDASFLEMLDVLNESLILDGTTRSRSTTTAARASAAPAAW